MSTTYAITIQGTFTDACGNHMPPNPAINPDFTGTFVASNTPTQIGPVNANPITAFYNSNGASIGVPIPQVNNYIGFYYIENNPNEAFVALVQYTSSLGNLLPLPNYVGIAITSAQGQTVYQLFGLNTVGGRPSSEYTSTTPNAITITPLSNICFPAHTPITVDQGCVNIEDIDPTVHTIDTKKIIAVTKTIGKKNYLVCLEQGALGNNLPVAETIISPEHKILYKGNMIEAKHFIVPFEHVYKIKYNKTPLYNVLLAEHYKMQVNGLTVETLHPENEIALLYTGQGNNKEKTIEDYSINKAMNAVIYKNKKVERKVNTGKVFLIK